MSRLLALFTVLSVCAGAFGQSFECYPVGPLPADPSAGCEGVDSNNLGGFSSGSGVVNNVSCGFPTAGVNYLRMDANGPISVPNGGPFPWSVTTTNPPCEVRVPIPSGATFVSFDWEYFNSETFGSMYNDGMAVAVLSASGGLLQQLVYADNQVVLGSCVASPSPAGTEIAPNGFQTFSGPLPPLGACAYLSFVCWNGLDNAVSSHAYVDNIQFNSAGASCPVPCFGTPGPALSFSSPGGSGCVLVTMTGLPSGGQYFFPVTLNAGAFPNGWLFGIDIAFTELSILINAGFPFLGPLGTGSCASGGATIGQFCGLPPGLSVYAVALGFPVGSSFPSVHTSAGTYTIP